MGPRVARLIRSGALDPALNMALDEALLLGDGPFTIRIYDWRPPALSLGYFQRAAQVDRGRLEQLGFGLVRRLTGGGAIAHAGEVTFAITGAEREAPYAGPIERSYELVHDAIAAGLAQLGAPAHRRALARLDSDAEHGDFYCFYKSSPVDLASAGRKLLGSAQRRVGGRVLHHGSLPCERNPITPESSYLEAVLGRRVGLAEAADAVLAGLAQGLGLELEPGEPTPAEHALAERLAAEKYRDPKFLFRR